MEKGSEIKFAKGQFLRIAQETMGVLDKRYKDWEGIMFTDFIKLSKQMDRPEFNKIDTSSGCFGYF